MTAIETLSSIIAQRGKVSISSFGKQVGLDPLLDAGLIRVDGKVQSIFCDVCSDQHDAEVVFQNENYGFYCHDVGFCPVDESDVTAIKPNIGVLVAHLAALFDCKRRKSTPIRADTWRIGSIDTPSGDLSLYFHPSLQSEQDFGAVQSALHGEARSAFRLIITAVGVLPVSNAMSARLEDIVELTNKTNKLRTLVDPRTIADVPQALTNGRPNLYAHQLEPLILQRIEDGNAHKGLNKEAKSIREVLSKSSPDVQVPSLSTIKSYLSKIRAGQ